MAVSSQEPCSCIPSCVCVCVCEREREREREREGGRKEEERGGARWCVAWVMKKVSFVFDRTGSSYDF